MKLEKAEMSPALRFTDLGQLIEDHAFREAASRTLAYVNHLGEPQVAALQDPERRERLFEDLWSRWVEPESAESLNSAIEDSVELAYNMAHQGVVIDHVLHLASAAPLWRDRVEALLGATTGAATA